MRYTLLSKITIENGIDIYDPASVNWSKFTFKNEFKLHKLNKFEILKPYLISYKYYSSVDYDDIVLLINGISNIFEVLPGTEIKIPFIEDIKDFIVENKQ